MRVASGRVVEGKVVLEGEPLAEGAVVTVRQIEVRSSPGSHDGSSCAGLREDSAAH